MCGRRDRQGDHQRRTAEIETNQQASTVDPVGEESSWRADDRSRAEPRQHRQREPLGAHPPPDQDVGESDPEDAVADAGDDLHAEDRPQPRQPTAALAVPLHSLEPTG